MLIRREGRIITVEVEDSDLNPGDEEMQMDALLTGLGFVAAHLHEARDFVLDSMPGELEKLVKDFNERWEL